MAEETQPVDVFPHPLRSPLYTHQLRLAREDAGLLLSFAVQSHRSPGDENTRKLLLAIGALDARAEHNQTPTPAEQADFWKAYDGVAVTMAPVSAFSIRSTRLLLDPGVWWRKLVRPTTGLATLAILVFAVSLVAQFYWVSGRDLLEQATTLSKQKADALDELGRLRDEYERVLQEQTSLSPAPKDDGWVYPSTRSGSPLRQATLPRTARPVAPSAEEATQLARREAKLELLAEAAWRNELANRRLERSIDTNARATADLVPALTLWYRLCPPWLCDREWLENHFDDIERRKKRLAELENKQREMLEGLELKQRSDSAVRVVPPGLDADRTIARSRLTRDITAERLEIVKRGAEQSREMLHRMQLFLRGFDAYLIPMLMGWLGALTFMLRNLVAQLRDSAYTPLLASMGLIRMVLGMMAGALGGLFVSATDASTLKSLPPMALPFVFGYGVEILFSLLDRFVKAFTTAPEKA